MDKKRILIIAVIMIILPITYLGIQSYLEVREEKNLTEELISKSESYSDNKEIYEGFKELENNKERKQFLEGIEKVKDRSKAEKDEQYLKADTNKEIDIHEAKDGVYLIYDEDNKDLKRYVEDYYHQTDRPNLYIMNKGLEQGYVQYYMLYNNITHKDIDVEDMPYAFYVRGGSVRKEYKNISDLKGLPDGSIEKELEEVD